MGEKRGKLKPAQLGASKSSSWLPGGRGTIGAQRPAPAPPPGALQGLKSAFSKRYELAEVLAVASVFVSGDFQGEGYGLAMYLKALELASVKGYWLANDTKRSTSDSAAATWRALFRYADKTLEGPPPPEELFDLRIQVTAVATGPTRSRAIRRSWRRTDRVFAAFGLNRMGVRALQRWKSGSDLGNGR